MENDLAIDLVEEDLDASCTKQSATITANMSRHGDFNNGLIISADMFMCDVKTAEGKYVQRLLELLCHNKQFIFHEFGEVENDNFFKLYESTSQEKLHKYESLFTLRTKYQHNAVLLKQHTDRLINDYNSYCTESVSQKLNQHRIPEALRRMDESQKRKLATHVMHLKLLTMSVLTNPLTEKLVRLEHDNANKEYDEKRNVYNKQITLQANESISTRTAAKKTKKPSYNNDAKTNIPSVVSPASKSGNFFSFNLRVLLN